MSDGRKRVSFRTLFSRNDRRAPNPTNAPLQPSHAGSTAITPQTPAHVSKRLLDSVVDALSSEDRETIQSHLSHGADDICATVSQAYQSALVQKGVCEARQWRWTFRNGHPTLLRDKASKVLAWLDRFKNVGDVVANVDPVHIGLPWAGIRILLEMAVSESRQMASLLHGLDLALAMANRLQVYFEYLLHLPSILATVNFETALVKMYTHVLRILATAIRTYQMNVRTRVWQALWQDSILENFETDMNKLELRAEIEASNCDRQLASRNWDDARSWKDDLDTSLQKLNDIQGIKKSLNSLHVKADLSKLHVAKDATYNSYVEGHLALCLPGTRTQILQQVAVWAGALDNKHIFWLCGMAGTGKSTISRSVAHDLDKQGRLGASFFFKRGEGDRRNASLFFPTLATQLIDKIPELGDLVAAALNADSLLCTRNLQDQFEKLLLHPLLMLSNNGSPLPNIVIVIDALDECERAMDVRTILKVLAQLGATTSVHLRVFVTSRPELPIQLGFQQLNGDIHQDVVLEQVQASTIEHDIRAYFHHRLDVIREEDRLTHPYDGLPLDWPGDENIETLVRLAIPLFIFAFTVCLYVSESNPRHRLNTILEQRQHGSLSGLGKTYQPILDQLLLSGTGDKCDTAIADFRNVVGPIILLADPLSAASLSSLLEIPLRNIGDILKNLHSVLSIPKNYEVSIRLFHLSFRDYLIDPQEKGNNDFWIDQALTHGTLAGKCLRKLSQPGILRQDLCGIKWPGTRRAEISRQQVNDIIAADVAYACSYWVKHVISSGRQLHDDDEVHQFLQQHILYWLEALSWLGRLSNVIGYISDLRSIVSVHRGDQLLRFLEDAQRFTLRYRHVIDLAPLQVYHSAIIFTPRRSIIRDFYHEHASDLLDILPDVPTIWNAEIQKLEGHSDSVEVVAFSPNGQMIASASDDETVRIWNTSTGEEIHKLQGHQLDVSAVAFSPDQQVIASGSEDKTVRLWNLSTGEEIQILTGHGSTVKTVAFSPDGQKLVSASSDGIVRLWNILAGGIELMRSDKYSSKAHAAVFSLDGQTFALGSSDGTVRLCDTSSGEEIQELDGHEFGAKAVAFSPEGERVVTTAGDRAVRLWNISTGKQVLKLQGQDPWLEILALSTDGQTMASTSKDRTIHLWNTSTGEEIQKLQGHSAVVNTVAFATNGQTIASGSSDGTVRLWSRLESGQIQKLKGHDDSITTLLFSPDGRTVASISDDHIARLWNALTGEEMFEYRENTHLRDATACSDRPVRLWNAAIGECGEVQASRKGVTWRVPGTRAESTVAFSPDGETVALTFGDRLVRLLDVATGREMAKLEGHGSPVLFVAFSPDGRTVASTSSDCTVRLWNVSMNKEVQRFEGHVSPVTKVAFSLDGQRIATLSKDSVAIWNTSTGKELQRFESHALPTQVAALSANGRIFVSSFGLFTAMFDMSTSKIIQELNEVDYFVTAVAVSPDGQNIAWAYESMESKGLTIKLWNASMGEKAYAFPDVRPIDQMSFRSDGRALNTNIGEFSVLPSPNTSESALPEISPVFVVGHQWIKRAGRDMLWLPHEYRGSHVAVHGDTVVIGQVSGAITFLKFREEQEVSRLSAEV